jgi:hypothetical protein
MNRDTLTRMAPGLSSMTGGFGTREEVDPIRHPVMTAAGWGGNPERDAHYVPVFPERNDGSTAYSSPLPTCPSTDSGRSASTAPTGSLSRTLRGAPR